MITFEGPGLLMFNIEHKKPKFLEIFSKVFFYLFGHGFM
jgi:hypothetical protein